jgi:hypothetical protein
MFHLDSDIQNQVDLIFCSLTELFISAPGIEIVERLFVRWRVPQLRMLEML